MGRLGTAAARFSQLGPRLLRDRTKALAEDSPPSRSRAAAIASFSRSTPELEAPAMAGRFMHDYRSQVVVNRCAGLLARTIARGRLVFELGDDPDNREPVSESHPVWEVFRKANASQSFSQLVNVSVLSKLLAGVFYWELARATERGPVAALYHMRARAVKAVPSSDGFAGFVYQPAGPRSKKWFAARDVFRSAYVDPDDDFVALSPFAAAFRTLLSDELTDKRTNAVLSNSALLSGVLGFDKDTTNEQLDDAQTAIEEDFVGADNQGKVLLLKGAEKWLPMEMKPAELQSLELKAWNREQVIHLLGIYSIVYGLMDASATRENATIQRKLFYEITVEPHAQEIADDITELLLPALGLKASLDGVHARFDFGHHPVYQELREQRGETDREHVKAGILRPDEARAGMGYEEAPGGGSLYMPVSMVPIAPPEPVESSVEVVAGGALANAPAQDSALNGAQVESAVAIVERVVTGQLPREAALGQLQVFYRLTEEDAERILGPIGRGWTPEPAPEGVTGSSERGATPGSRESSGRSEAILGALRAKGLRKDPDPESLTEWVASGKLPEDHPLMKELGGIFGDVLAAAAGDALVAVGADIDFDLAPDLGYLREKVIQFADATWNTTSEALRSTLLEGVNAGENITDLFKRADEVFEGRKKNALTVARTEVGGTANRGAQSAYRQAGLEENEWSAFIDKATRDTHEAIDGEVAKIGEPFSNGLEFPGDTSTGNVAEFANCRCTVLAIVPGYSDAEKRAAYRAVAHKQFGDRLDTWEPRVERHVKKILDAQRERVRAAMGVRS